MVVRQLIALPSQLQLIDRLQHHIYLSSSLIFVSGGEGAGKTTLLEQLANKLPDDIQEAFIQLNDQLTESQIRQQIIIQFYENPLFDAHDTLFSSLSLLQGKQENEIPRLIIFDNAHFLSAELLVELAELIVRKKVFGESEINVLLLADEESCKQMFTSANQACACLEFKLEALSADESNSLLNHIFKQAGYQQQIQNQDAVLKQLNICAGIPQKIILLAELIIAGELKQTESSWLKTRLPAILLMVILLLVAAGLASYLYSLFIEPVKQQVDVIKAPQKKEILLNNTPVAAIENKVALAKPPAPAMVEALAGSWEKEPHSDIQDNLLQVGISDAEVKGVTPSEQDIKDILQEKKVVIEESVVIEDNQESLETESPKEADNLTEPSNTAVDVQVVVEIESAALATESEKKEPKKEPDRIFTEKSKLLSVSASHYTLQLSAMASRASLQRFISEYSLPKADFYVYQTTRNNKPWYVVIYGEYDSWAAAKKATQTLPESLIKLGSWIKKYQLVHQDLQLNNE